MDFEQARCGYCHGIKPKMEEDMGHTLNIWFGKDNIDIGKAKGGTPPLLYMLAQLG
ncbi:MAG: hypothetical protein FWG10_01645 [Eubacteriaceae bacterium]|nr:hypothetical protein [Eubacteriaceae bacterium]